MNNHELQACNTARTFSSAAAVVAVIATVIFSSLLDHQSLHWQIAVATVALAIGIPHGALDHLVARPTGSGSTMFGFVVRYVLTAVVALVAILIFNMIGFVLILVMSAVHFGIGDTAFIAEIDKRTATKPMPLSWLYAISAGFVPVIIPLTKSTSESALQEINVNIVGWHGGFNNVLLFAAAILAFTTFIALVVNKRYRDAFDIALLVLLSVVAPPLIAFAVYFGCWHAVRHTARLTLVLPSSQKAFARGSTTKAFWSAVIPGLPALIGALLAAVAIGAFTDFEGDSLLWTMLAIVWALTVPHMAATTRLDRGALANIAI
jgi:Brp/Blh family beta-carotene 15,15'-monooxygenase